MRTLMITFLCIMGIGMNAQESARDFLFNDKVVHLKTQKSDEGYHQFVLETRDTADTFLIYSFNYEIFEAAFRESMKTLTASDSLQDTAYALPLKEQAMRLFYELKAEERVQVADRTPIAGILKTKKQVNLIKNKDTIGVVDIREIDVELYEGFIEVIKVNGTVNDRSYRFENRYGIGFSTKGNFNNLSSVRLWDMDKNVYINLGELLDYDYGVGKMTRDFSPGNDTIKVMGGEEATLYKDQTSKLFEAVVFSDFLGIDKDKPNGLIQTELSKRINTNTYRAQTWHKLDFAFQGYGFFQYVRPFVAISKVEENNRYHSPLRNDSVFSSPAGNDTMLARSFITPIEALNHQNLSLGVDVNLIYLDNPEMKFNISINGGFRFNRTSIRDSLRILREGEIVATGLVKEFGISYYTVYPEIVIHFMPEERFGLILTNRWQCILPGFDTPLLTSFDRKLQSQAKLNRWVNTIEVMAYAKTGENGRLFARWRQTNQLGNPIHNFHQVQVGYSFYLLKRHD